MAALTHSLAARSSLPDDSPFPASSSASAEAAGNDSFPAGLRVLVVDDDPICLLILDRMLRQCQYQVTACGRAAEALAKLRENKDGFDVIISDVYMPDMDGFKLLELVGLEMDLPVIMMSANGDTNVVMKGIKHGACDYLLKPVRLEELRNIWQHVVRRRWRSSFQINCEAGKTRQVTDDGDHNSLTNEELDATWKQGKKRKDLKEEEEEIDADNEDLSTSKKPRVVWSVDLHQQFVNAVNQLGIDKAVPKRILELMNVQGLTRENVASHLQKYRLYLKRISSGTHQTGGVVPNFPLASMESNFNAAGLGSFNELQAFTGASQLSPQVLASTLQAGTVGRLGSANGGGIGNIDPALMMQIAALQNTHSKPPAFVSHGNEKGPFQAVAATSEINQLQHSQMGAFVGLCDSASPSLLAIQKQQLQSTTNVGRISKSPVPSNNSHVNQKDNSLIMQSTHHQHEPAGCFTSTGVLQKPISRADSDIWASTVSNVNPLIGSGNGGIIGQSHSSAFKADSESTIRRASSASNIIGAFRRVTDGENKNRHISNVEHVSTALSTASAMGHDNHHISGLRNVDSCPAVLNDGISPLLSGLKQEEFQAMPVSQGNWKTFNTSQGYAPGRNERIQTISFDHTSYSTRSFSKQEPEQFHHHDVMGIPINTSAGRVRCLDQDQRNKVDKSKEENKGWHTEPLTDDLISIVLKQEQGRLGITERESSVMSYLGSMYSKTDH